MRTLTRPLLRYHGGKWRLAPWIISHFPEHRVYVEPFGGAGSVLLQKRRSYAEVYNDLDGEIVNLFRVVRDDGSKLLRALSLTPFAREEFNTAWQPSSDPVEQARRTVIRSFMGFGSSAVTMTRAVGKRSGKSGTGFRAQSNRSYTTPAHDWRNFAGTGFRTYTGDSDGRCNRGTLPCGDWSPYGDALTPIIDRLRGVVIENKDAIELMTDHDGTKTLHYNDPPYVSTTRDAGIDYKHEMTDKQHITLAKFLHTLKGMVIISGYDCPLYTKLYRGWRTTKRNAMADGAIGNREREEKLWISPNTPHDPTLFTDTI